MLEEEPENDVLGSHGADLLLTTIMTSLKTRLLSSLVLVLFPVGVEAQMAISKRPEFKGNAASVDIRDIGGGGAHYGDSGATYAKVGDRMGRAMAKLLQGE